MVYTQSSVNRSRYTLTKVDKAIMCSYTLLRQTAREPLYPGCFENVGNDILEYMLLVSPTHPLCVFGLFMYTHPYFSLYSSHIWMIEHAYKTSSICLLVPPSHSRMAIHVYWLCYSGIPVNTPMFSSCTGWVTTLGCRWAYPCSNLKGYVFLCTRMIMYTYRCVLDTLSFSQ